ncbi:MULTISPECIES: hypothetical protein [Haloferacaceae]|uniref:Uncharacterized protein n=1 Tax=Halorubrum glutamatedens TaxID=2707018 RepID=A0ABD5QRI4_9EURY|nr:hypothetical protein [Halobellus captivus]
MTKEDLLRNRLNDPNVTIENIREDEIGYWANIVFSGTEQQYHEFVEKTEDIIHGGPLALGRDGVHAEVRLR